MPIWPTPAAARYKRHGDPRPPAPITSTEAFLSNFWPAIPTSLNTKCREYRAISPLFNSAKNNDDRALLVDTNTRRGGTNAEEKEKVHKNMDRNLTTIVNIIVIVIVIVIVIDIDIDIVLQSNPLQHSMMYDFQLDEMVKSGETHSATHEPRFDHSKDSSIGYGVTGVYLPVCLSVCQLSVCLSVYLSVVCLSVCLSIRCFAEYHSSH